MIMKKVLLFGSFFMGLALSTFAQEAANEPVTDEDLTQYATVEVMTSLYVEDKTDELRNMILNNEVIDGGARYNEIKAAWGDDAKLTEANVTDEEKAAYQAILDFQNSLQQSVVDYKTNLITDSDVISVSVYNKVLAAIKGDPSVKEKLDSMILTIKEEKDAERAAAKEDGEN
ncbi:hypothetical protein SAMN04488519_106180 [Algoriphagus ornithinivorans]|uniref:DUF4168 domain-containing protein n=2 Tax=Algoriphagus ornithinivorans TaxID=226506 RepID=A0A1I5GZE4_9BACT|nr:hypothetical protein SAMN04488519_106180 [Algoriphagus ornithinivorans]